MIGSRDQETLQTYMDTFADRLTDQSDEIVQTALRNITREAPELAGPDPGLRDTWIKLFCANISSLATALRQLVPLEHLTVAQGTSDYARMVAQRGVPPHSLLIGQHFCEHSIILEAIRCAAMAVEDRDDLAQVMEIVLGYCFAHSGIALKEGMEANVAVRASWQRGRGAGLSRRLNQILNREVTDQATAEDMLGYRLTGNHLAVIAWCTEVACPDFDLAEIERLIRTLPGVSEALVVPQDEQTLACWLRVPSDLQTGNWTKAMRKAGVSVRFALGDPAPRLEGFLSTYRQAQIAASVLVRTRRKAIRIVRYREVSAISFLLGHPAASRAWAESVLGELAGPGNDLQILRHTLYMFLEASDSFVAASQRLHVHRNTVRYRINRATELLPTSLEERRLDIYLALMYCEWIPLGDSSRDAYYEAPHSPDTTTGLL